MLYRVLIGLIPTVLIALFMTGAMPAGGVLPSSEYRSSAVRAEEGAAQGAAQGKDGDKRGSPRTPEGQVSRAIGILSPDQIGMMEDNMKAVEEMHRAIEKEEDKERRGVSGDWEPKGSWGR
jgi:hypothetical protein